MSAGSWHPITLQKLPTISLTSIAPAMKLFLKTMHDNMPDFNKIYIALSVGLLTL
jgi:hypothetical protein